MIGGAGLIGSHTVDQLTKEDVSEIVIYDNFVRGTMKISPPLCVIRASRSSRWAANICQTDILNAALKDADGVFHFAALWLLQCHEYPRAAFDVNVRGTFNVLEACVRNGVKRLVCSSSASVYGDAIEEPMSEDHPFNNKNFYGATKICGEAMARAYHHPLRSQLCRAALHERLRSATGLSRRLYRRHHEDARCDRSRRGADNSWRRFRGIRLRRSR